jgi:hypothetical protein
MAGYQVDVMLRNPSGRAWITTVFVEEKTPEVENSMKELVARGLNNDPQVGHLGPWRVVEWRYTEET